MNERFVVGQHLDELQKLFEGECAAYNATFADPTEVDEIMNNL